MELHFKTERTKPVRNVENSLDILQSVVENPHISDRKCARSLALGKSTVQNVLAANKFKAFKPRYVQTLQEHEYDNRSEFCFMVQGEIEIDRTFPRKILFTDEATFTTNGVVSSQNCRWWSTGNPKFRINCKNQYSRKINVWCGILNRKIIGPYILRQSLNSERYLEFLNMELENEFDMLPLATRNSLWFMQDVAPAHSARVVVEYLNEQFNEKWIGT